MSSQSGGNKKEHSDSDLETNTIDYSGPFNDYVKKCEEIAGDGSFSRILAANVDTHFDILHSTDTTPIDFARTILMMYIKIRRAHKDLHPLNSVSTPSDYLKCECGCARFLLNEVVNRSERILYDLNQGVGTSDNTDWEWEDDVGFFVETEFDKHVFHCAQTSVEAKQSEEVISPSLLDTTTTATNGQQQQQQSKQRQHKQQSQQQRQSSIKRIVWSNPPSLSLITDPDDDPSVFVLDFKQFGTFWRECCQNVFFDDVPSKFDLCNIDRVELDENDEIQVSFYRRPKKFLLEEFAEQVSACGLAIVDVCDTFDVSPTPSPQKRSPEWTPRVRIEATTSTTPTSSTKSFANVVSSRQQHSPSNRHKRQHQHEQSRHRREVSSYQQRAESHSRRKTQSRQLFTTPPFGRSAYKRNARKPPDRFPTRETSMPGLGGSGMNKLTQLERKIDFVMSFLIKHYGFT